MISVAPQYAGQYPLQGDVALLCEGDVIGYEVAGLRRWLPARPLVDIWACGTCDALYGMSDALGRSRPVIVVEDRDYRTADQVDEDCRKRKADRAHRGVNVAGWFAWERHEIENYLLEPAVLLPVMEQWFGCSRADVQAALEAIIATMPVCQACGWSLYQMRRKWHDSDIARHLSSLPGGRSIRPRWQDSSDTWSAVEPTAVEDWLKGNLDSWCRRFACEGSPDRLAAREWAELFEDRFAAWSSVRPSSTVWLADWSGKEILYSLFVALSHIHGWPVRSGTRTSILWDPMSRAERDAKLREIETELRRDLVEGLLTHLESDPSPPIAPEWYRISAMVQAADPP